MLEGISWRNAYKEVRKEAQGADRSLSDHLTVSSDPTAQTVFYEDTAALIGLVLAIAALVLHHVTGSAVYDAVASILIGVLLSVVAFLLTRHNRRLLIDSSAPPDLVQRMHDELAVRPGSWRCPRCRPSGSAPGSCCLAADLVYAPGEDVVARIAELREELLEEPVIAAVKLTPVAA